MTSDFFTPQGAGMTSKSDEWETPQKMFDELNKIYKFNYDLAANDQNHKLDNYFTLKENSLIQDWKSLDGWQWLNPPYGRQLKFWVKKALESTTDKVGGEFCY